MVSIDPPGKWFASVFTIWFALALSFHEHAALTIMSFAQPIAQWLLEIPLPMNDRQGSGHLGGGAV
jgi:hypothetical protein